MQRLELQNFLFSKEPTRTELYKYSSVTPKAYKIFVYRNHSFELIEHTIGAYLDYADIGVEFAYSNYDDSLSFAELDTTCDALILWLDLSRYNNIDDSFFTERLAKLDRLFPKPKLIIAVNALLTANVPKSCVVFNTLEIAAELGEKFNDTDKERFTGTKLSAKACLKISKSLGLRYIPAVLQTPLKAIVLDLDNTLYSGVVGEDGVDGVILTDEHKSLQLYLKHLHEQGFFLCVASKNDKMDVEILFERRSDFPLQLGNFDKICSSWDSKADMIEEIAKFLNIHTSAMLFIDDNIGELHTVLATHPEIRWVLAYSNADQTLAVLQNQPGLMKLSATAEDTLRNLDVQAKEQRELLKVGTSTFDYLRSLETTLTFSVDNPMHAERIAELACKTNQFIFNYKRYKQYEVEQLQQSTSNSTVVTVSLKDKLSNSGIIGVCVAILRDGYVEIEEILVSCRALGRELDDVIVLGSIAVACEKFGVNRIKIDFVNGERNTPAQKFISKKLQQYLEQPAEFVHELLIDFITIKKE